MSAPATTAPARPGPVQASAAEWTRLWTVRSTWWSLAAATIGMVLLGVALGAESSGPVSGDVPEAWLAGQVGLVPVQFALLTMVLLAVTSEYATGAISTSLQWTPRRPVLFAARAAVTVAVAVVVGVLLAAVAGLTAWAIAPALDLGGAATGLGTVAAVLASGGALAVGAGFLLRSTAAALAAVFLLLLVLPVILPLFGIAWLATVGANLPGAGALHLLTGEGPAAGMTDTTAWVLLAVWGVGALVAGGAAFLRRDSA